LTVPVPVIMPAQKASCGGIASTGLCAAPILSSGMRVGNRVPIPHPRVPAILRDRRS
jgi:hypothetical protein